MKQKDSVGPAQLQAMRARLLDTKVPLKRNEWGQPAPIADPRTREQKKREIAEGIKQKKKEKAKKKKEAAMKPRKREKTEADKLRRKRYLEKKKAQIRKKLGPLNKRKKN